MRRLSCGIAALLALAPGLAFAGQASEVAAGAGLPASLSFLGTAAPEAVTIPESVDAQRPTTRPRASQEPLLGLRVNIGFEYERMQAVNTFRSLFGNPSVPGFGLGADVVIAQRYFFRMSFSHETRNGTRGFVANGQFFSTGVPLALLMRPVEIGGGLRFGSTKHPGLVCPYIGGAFLLTYFQQTSPQAESSDEVPAWFHGGAVFGGAEFAFGRHLAASAELEYRTLPNAIGGSDVSQSFDESNLGGVVARVLFNLKFGRF